MTIHTLDEMYIAISNSGMFDVELYLSMNPDVATAGIDPLRHYLEFGSAEGRKPDNTFDPLLYLELNPDVRDAGVEPFFHYVVQGVLEGRQVNKTSSAEVPAVPEQKPKSAQFDAQFYLNAYADVAAAGVDPEWHYYSFGESEGRRPNAEFDPVFYAQVNPDVAEAGVGLFRHFSETGYKEGRLPTSPSIDLSSFKGGKNILFIGHDAMLAGAQRVLLSIVKWFAEHSDYNVYTLLCNVGPLVTDYARYSTVFACNNYNIEANPGIEKLSEIKWEFIYANTVRSGAAAARIASKLKIRAPIISHVHELQNVLNEFPQELEKMIGVSSHLIVVNAEIKTYLSSKFAFPESRISVEAPFIEALSSFSEEGEPSTAYRQEARNALGLSDSHFVVVGCGTAYHRKGIDIFVETGLTLVAQDSANTTRFVWIGDGDDLDAARERVKQVGFGDRFIFTGHRRDADALIACGDVFFLSSREDPFPLVCLEAAQYGIPVVYFDAGTGIGEFLQGGTQQDAAGLVAKAFSHESAAQKIGKMRSNAKLRKKMGSQAYCRLFSDYEAGQKLVRLYALLVSLNYVRPSISVIVPNYNHAPYLKERLDSIRHQTIRTIEVIVLDDASIDQSKDVIKEYLADPRFRFTPNEVNSGSPFLQWERGIAASQADVVWIAESDDIADVEFCRILIGSFRDPLVNVASGKTVIVDRAGSLKPSALSEYYDGAELDLFRGSWKRDGHEFVRAHFGARCTLVNASGLLLRKSRLAASMQGAGAYKMCGDWLIYLRMLKHGKLYFNESAVNYFRRHETSAVHKIEGTSVYFRERASIAEFVVSHYLLSRQEIRRMIFELRREWQRFAYKNEGSEFDEYIDRGYLLSRSSARRGNIALYVHGMLFSRGGIERIAAQLCERLSFVGYRVFLYSDRRGTAPVYSLPETVVVSGVDLSQADGRLQLSDSLRRNQIDVFIPMLSESIFESAIDSGLAAGVKIIASEHNDPWQIALRWWDEVRRQEYFDRVDSVHLLLPKFLKSLTGVAHSNAFVIPNGVALDSDYDTVSSCLSNEIVCVARFSKQKRLDVLISAFGKVADKFPEWRLTLIGDGELRGELLQLIRTLGLQDKVDLPGVIEDVHYALTGASIFALPSEFEGFGIVILEAQRAGLPCVAFADCNGPNSLIKHDVDGLLARRPGVDGLAMELEKLMKSPELRQKMGAAGRNNVRRYSLEDILNRWVQEIDRLVKADASHVVA